MDRKLALTAVSLIFVLSPWAVAQTPSGAMGPSNLSTAMPVAHEPVDLAMYSRIRAEGFDHSHIMEYAGGLIDGIGERLTGSPNLKEARDWSVLQLRSMGASNVHLEDWGVFGVGWRQRNTWVRMISPDYMVFVAQAAPWSACSQGTIKGEAVVAEIEEDKDLDRYRGKLGGKVVFLGRMRDVLSPAEPFSRRYTAEQLATGVPQAPIDKYYRTREQRLQQWSRVLAFEQKIAAFLKSEHVAGVILPSRDSEAGGGTGIVFVDGGLGAKPWLRENALPFPIIVTAIEDYGRVYRLFQHGVPVSVELNVDVETSGDREHGFNTVAEIPGTDPKLAEQVVIFGAHLDSWAAGTGATDDGTGVAITLEAMRILKTLGIRPRRTIRLVLYDGEEEGLLGSSAYARAHFGEFPRSTAPDQANLPFDELRRPAGPLVLRPEHNLVSAIYNIDAGSGLLRGIFTGGNFALVPIFQDWIAPLRDLGITAVANTRDWPADEASFEEIGLPGLDFMQDPLDYFSRSHHSNMDTLERLSPDDLKQAAVVEAIFVYDTAMRDEKLPRLQLPHPELYEQDRKPLDGIYGEANQSTAPLQETGTMSH